MNLNSPADHFARTPDNVVVFAVGDIHGRLDLLEGMTRRIAGEATEGREAATQVVAVFLGDYIDRGPGSAGVLRHLIDFRAQSPCALVFLRGNHEQMLLDLIDGTATSNRWLGYGGADTLMSYGVPRDSLRKARGQDALRQIIVDTLPADHVEFLRQTSFYRQFGDYICVHAGLRADRLLEEQSLDDMLWFRHRADEKPIWSQTVVHGHSPHQRPVVDTSRIAIDTGAFSTGVLTAVRLEGAERRFLKSSRPGGGPAEVSDWAKVSDAL